MEQVFFWVSWWTSVGITAFLLFWSLPLSPFTYPGTTANEAAIIFLIVMVMRWFALATALVLVTIAWGRHLNLTTQWMIGLLIVVLALHLVLGIVNLGVTNAWLSIDSSKSRAINPIYAVIYFALPTLVLSLTAPLMFIVARFR